MNRQPYRTPPQWWSPRPSVMWMRLWRPFRRIRALRQQGLVGVEVRGLEHLSGAVAADQGVLVTPNHASHADPFVLLEAADQLNVPFHFMTAWQVFAMTHRLGRRVLQQHGCFSINREGHDLRALRFAVDVLQQPQRPLVIFPEGEVFHLNDRVMPFRRGAASAALMAAGRSDRPVAIVPCAMKFQFVEDPQPNLLALTSRLEEALFWRSRPGLPLARRVHQLVEGVLAVQEVAHLGGPQTGSVGDRITRLTAVLIGRLEDRYRLPPVERTIPERVKRLRHRVIRRLESASTMPEHREQCVEDLDHLFLVMQLFSYPADYLAGTPSLERLGETLDKLEEDVLGVKTAGVRGLRRAVVSFGAPLVVQPQKYDRSGAEILTRRLQQQVQHLLDDINPPQPQAAPVETLLPNLAPAQLLPTSLSAVA